LYNLTFFAIILVLFQSNAIEVEHRARYIASVVFLVLGVGSTVIALMGQKWYFVRSDKALRKKGRFINAKYTFFF